MIRLMPVECRAYRRKSPSGWQASASRFASETRERECASATGKGMDALSPSRRPHRGRGLFVVAVPALANQPAVHFTEDVTGDVFACDTAVYTVTSGTVSIVVHEGQSPPATRTSPSRSRRAR